MSRAWVRGQELAGKRHAPKRRGFHGEGDTPIIAYHLVRYIWYALVRYTRRVKGGSMGKGARPRHDIMVPRPASRVPPSCPPQADTLVVCRNLGLTAGSDSRAVPGKVPPAPDKAASPPPPRPSPAAPIRRRSRRGSDPISSDALWERERERERERVRE